MRHLAIPAGILAAALTLTACGSGNTDDPKAAPSPSWSNPGAIPNETQKLAFGQPATVLGTDDVRMRVTPTAVLYHRGPYKDGDKPENGWYIAISVKAEALDQTGTVAAGAGGGGFEWRGAGQTITAMDGNTSGTPWVGSVPELTVDQPIEVNDPREGIETFDIPSKAGGRLVYLSPEDDSITATWDLPSADQGSTPGMVKVRKRIKLFT